jgi:phospholipase/carboxylesterase
MEIFGTLKTIVVDRNASIDQRTADRQQQPWIVLCHGYGANGADLLGVAEAMLEDFEQAKVYPRIYFPEAPIDLSDDGMPGGKAWWRLNMARLMALAQINDFSEMRREVPPGIDLARNELQKCLEAIVARDQVSLSNLWMGGFSQGAMLSAHLLLSKASTDFWSEFGLPRGLVLFSGALICEADWESGVDRLATINVLQSHGLVDPILPFSTGSSLRDLIHPHAMNAKWIEFHGPHTIPTEASRSFASMVALA